MKSGGRVYSVTQVNTYIRDMMRRDVLLRSLVVRGEVSNCTYHGSGHIYFTLKDKGATLSVIMFASDRAGLNFRLADGQQVQVTGRIDILVNATGINKLEKAEEYPSSSWDDVLGINLRGLFLTTREVGKIMKEQHYGRILSISSVKSFIGTDRDYIAYCASKGGVNMFTKQIACEWGKYGITANAIAPTFTRTPINAFQLDDPVFYRKLVDRIPLGRICSAKDIGCAALFLCSDAAEFISGQVLAVDGGLTAMQ